MDIEKRKELVLRKIGEAVTEAEIKELLETKNKPVSYIGYACTGMMHIGHLTTVRKVADFVNANIDFKFLIADIHAELDIEKSPLELIAARARYYEEALKAMVKASGIKKKDVEFVKGSDFQHDKEYQKGYMRLMENSTVNRASRASSEVVRHSEGMKASGILYPFMQIMDCAALGIDIAYSGLDQRRIYMLGRETLPKIGKDKISCIFGPLVPGLSGGKMSASDATSKIGIHDSEKEIKDKINKAYCPQGERKDNGILGYLEYLVFPVLDGDEFVIERPKKYGGDLSYIEYSNLESDFLAGEIHPQDLKKATSKYINTLLKDIREHFKDKKDVLREAYPEEYRG